MRKSAYFIFILFLVCFLLTATGHAHSPLIPGDNERLAEAIFISDPAKSWAVYGELHNGMEPQYFRFNIERTKKIHITLSKSTNPENRDFMPGFTLMGPGIKSQGEIPGYVEIPDGVNTIVIAGKQPALATYEPFSASSFYPLADLVMEAPISGTYYIAVYEPTKGGSYILAVGDREDFSIIEWVLIPVKLIAIYQWDGQSIALIFFPIAAILVTGLIIWRRKRWVVKTPLEWTGILAGLLFFGSGATIFFQIFLALTRAPLVSEVLITIFLGVCSFLLGAAIILILSKKREKADINVRLSLIIIGILALFLWAGFLVGPFLAILAGLMPQKPISPGS